MHIALVDDDPRQLTTMKELLTAALGELGLDARMDSFPSAEAFLEQMAADKYDIILLDIYMDKLNGVEAARRIRQIDGNVALAFCTSSNEYAAQSYEVDARYYLQKPVSREKVSAMLRRFNLAKIERSRTVRLPDGSRVPLRYILYTEYLDHSVQFHIKGQPPRTVRTSQSEIEALLLGHKSFRVINKGCVVNFEQVRALQANAFSMQDGKTVPIARRRFKEIEAAYTRFLFEKMDREDMD